MTIDEIVARADTVFGWMTKDELYWLAVQARKHSRILEIGSYRGRSTMALALATSGTVDCVDDFRGEAATRDWHGAKLAAEFSNNLRAELAIGKVNLHCMTFAEFMESDDHGRFDMVFIDGTHVPAEAVAEDCRFANALIVPGGLVCGHDWTVGNVIEGVRQVFPNAGPIPGTETLWAVPA